jgi:hypothetical protein
MHQLATCLGRIVLNAFFGGEVHMWRKRFETVGHRQTAASAWVAGRCLFSRQEHAPLMPLATLRFLPVSVFFGS